MSSLSHKGHVLPAGRRKARPSLTITIPPLRSYSSIQLTPSTPPAPSTSIRRHLPVAFDVLLLLWCAISLWFEHTLGESVLDAAGLRRPAADEGWAADVTEMVSPGMAATYAPGALDRLVARVTGMARARGVGIQADATEAVVQDTVKDATSDEDAQFRPLEIWFIVSLCCMMFVGVLVLLTETLAGSLHENRDHWFRKVRQGRVAALGMSLLTAVPLSILILEKPIAWVLHWCKMLVGWQSLVHRKAD
ncbi:hypothetical protein BKA93DRAFT_492310 [Sparassis latifolia]